MSGQQPTQNNNDKNKQQQKQQNKMKQTEKAMMKHAQQIQKAVEEQQRMTKETEKFIQSFTSNASQPKPKKEAPLTVPNCKFGQGCTNQNCKFNHPRTPTTMVVNPTKAITGNSKKLDRPIISMSFIAQAMDPFAYMRTTPDSGINDDVLDRVTIKSHVANKVFTVPAGYTSMIAVCRPQSVSSCVYEVYWIVDGLSAPNSTNTLYAGSVVLTDQPSTNHDVGRVAAFGGRIYCNQISQTLNPVGGRIAGLRKFGHYSDVPDITINGLQNTSINRSESTQSVPISEGILTILTPDFVWDSPMVNLNDTISVTTATLPTAMPCASLARSKALDTSGSIITFNHGSYSPFMMGYGKGQPNTFYSLTFGSDFNQTMTINIALRVGILAQVAIRANIRALFFDLGGNTVYNRTILSSAFECEPGNFVGHMGDIINSSGGQAFSYTGLCSTVSVIDLQDKPAAVGEIVGCSIVADIWSSTGIALESVYDIVTSFSNIPKPQPVHVYRADTLVTGQSIEFDAVKIYELIPSKNIANDVKTSIVPPVRAMGDFVRMLASSNKFYSMYPTNQYKSLLPILLRGSLTATDAELGGKLEVEPGSAARAADLSQIFQRAKDIALPILRMIEPLSPLTRAIGQVVREGSSIYDAIVGRAAVARAGLSETGINSSCGRAGAASMPRSIGKLTTIPRARKWNIQSSDYYLKQSLKNSENRRLEKLLNQPVPAAFRAGGDQSMSVVTSEHCCAFPTVFTDKFGKVQNDGLYIVVAGDLSELLVTVMPDYPETIVGQYKLFGWKSQPGMTDSFPFEFTSDVTVFPVILQDGKIVIVRGPHVEEHSIDFALFNMMYNNGTLYDSFGGLVAYTGAIENIGGTCYVRPNAFFAEKQAWCKANLVSLIGLPLGSYSYRADVYGAVNFKPSSPSKAKFDFTLKKKSKTAYASSPLLKKSVKPQADEPIPYSYPSSMTGTLVSYVDFVHSVSSSQADAVLFGCCQCSSLLFNAGSGLGGVVLSSDVATDCSTCALRHQPWNFTCHLGYVRSVTYSNSTYFVPYFGFADNVPVFPISNFGSSFNPRNMVGHPQSAKSFTMDQMSHFMNLPGDHTIFRLSNAEFREGERLANMQSKHPFAPSDGTIEHSEVVNINGARFSPWIGCFVCYQNGLFETNFISDFTETNCCECGLPFEGTKVLKMVISNEPICTPMKMNGEDGGISAITVNINASYIVPILGVDTVSIP